MKNVVRSVCVFCGKEFFSTKKAKGCPACRRKRAIQRTSFFLKTHPEYSRRKMKEYRSRLGQGIMLQPQKSVGKRLAYITAQGWRLEVICQGGQYSWLATKENGVKLESVRTFPNAAQAREDIFEALG